MVYSKEKIDTGNLFPEDPTVLVVGEEECFVKDPQQKVNVVVGYPTTPTQIVPLGETSITSYLSDSSAAAEGSPLITAVSSASENNYEDEWTPATLRLNGPKAQTDNISSNNKAEFQDPYKNLRFETVFQYTPGSLMLKRELGRTLDLLRYRYTYLVSKAHEKLKMFETVPEVSDWFWKNVIAQELGVGSDAVNFTRAQLVRISDVNELNKQDLVLIAQYYIKTETYNTDPVCLISLAPDAPKATLDLVKQVNTVSAVIHRKIQEELGHLRNRIDRATGFRIISKALTDAHLINIDFIRELFLPETRVPPALKFLQRVFGDI